MSKQTKYPKYSVLDTEVDSISITEAVDHLIGHVKDLKAGAVYIVKPYVEQLERASRKTDMKRILNNAYLCLPDGVSINWAVYFQQSTKRRLWDVVTSGAKIVFRPLDLSLAIPNHAWGTNFTWSLLQAAAQKKVSLFLVGSPKHQSIEATAAYLKSKIPGLQISGTFPGRDPALGYFSKQLTRELVTKLQQTKPDIILLAIGSPAQEVLAAELALQLKHGVFIGEGGTFDFQLFGGKVKKAPTFMQKHGLEWLWRLLIDPRRIKRQLAIPRFIWKVYRSQH